MASITRKKHTFWEQYYWRAEDFLNFQTWVYDTIYALAEGRSGVLKGLKVTPVSGMQVQVSAGIGVTPAGKILVLGSNTNITLSSPIGNPSKNYLVLRANDTVSDQIQEPTNPLNTVTFTTLLGASLVEIAGTPAGSPVYPSLGADDLILMGWGFTAGMSTIGASNFETYKRATMGGKEYNARKVTASLTLDGTEEIVEVDSSGGAVSLALPSVYSMLGKIVSFVKLSSDSNSITLDPDGSETINGASSWDLDTQWQVARAYASPSGWVML